MKKVLVFGSSGMLGTYLSSLLENEEYEVVKNDRADGGIDITDEGEVRGLIKDLNPDVVVNSAAYTNVEKAEEEKEIAFKVNSDAPKYMSLECKSMDIPFVHISTDYVFGDNKEEGYTEECEDYNPLNVYGVSKLDGEECVKDSGCKYYILRTSWLFGPNATNFIEKISKYARELPELKVVTDEVGCPTYVGDLSRVILDILKGNLDMGVYHVCSKDTCSRYEFAKEILRLQDIQTPILECKLEDFNRKAVVPNYSQLINTKLPEMRSWKDMLTEYFDTTTKS